MKKRSALFYIYVVVLLASFPCFLSLSTYFSEQRKIAEDQLRKSVAYDWDIKYGIFNDDIVLINKSPFPLTNVVLDVSITQNANRWEKRLTCAGVDPQKSFLWEDAVSIPGSWTTTANATLNCDQLK